MGDKNNKLKNKTTSKLQKSEWDPVQRKWVLVNDIDPGSTVTPKTKQDKLPWYTRAKDHVVKTSKKVAGVSKKVVIATSISVKDKTTDIVVNTVAPLKDISDRAAAGEKIGIKEVGLTLGSTALNVGGVATGATLVPEAFDIVTDVAVNAEILPEDVADKAKTGIRIYKKAQGLSQESLLKEGLKFVGENDPRAKASREVLEALKDPYLKKNSQELLREYYTEKMLTANKKPGVKHSDKTAAAKALAKKVAEKNTPVVRTQAEASLMWKKHIAARIAAVNQHLINNGKKEGGTPFGGLGKTFRDELTDALMDIYLGNKSQAEILGETVNHTRKMYEIIRHYSTGEYHIDGEVKNSEYKTLNLFMKQYLTDNGSINLPTPTATGTQELQSSSLQDFAGANHGGKGGFKMETLEGETIWEALPGSHPHQTGETSFELKLLDKDGDVKQTLEFKEWMGDALCEEGKCGKCKELSMVSNINAVFDHAKTELQVWFDVEGLGQRGFEFPIEDINSEIKKNPATIVKVELELKENDDSNG